MDADVGLNAEAQRRGGAEGSILRGLTAMSPAKVNEEPSEPSDLGRVGSWFLESCVYVYWHMSQFGIDNENIRIDIHSRGPIFTDLRCFVEVIKKRKVVTVFGCSVLFMVFAMLTLPESGQAARQYEVETNYYSCPQDAESLQECTWNGMVFAPCEGSIITEGSLSGNYKTVYSENCSTSQWSVTCYEWCSVDWCLRVCM